jgi:uncharacterized protein with von Willebrand factor type A (vWA) domain
VKSFSQYIIENKDDFKPTHEGWHGTPDSRALLKNGFKTLKQSQGITDPESIHWASVDQGTARTYADPHRAFDYQNSEPKTLPVQLQMKNPKVINWGGKKFRGSTKEEKYNIHDHIDQARKDGHDGFVIHKVIDTYSAKGKPTTIMGVFDNKNIRVKQ